MDFQEVSFRDFANICRICLSKKDPLRPFLHLLDKFRLLTNIEVTPEDGLPKNLCIKCLNNLGDISLFIDLSKNSDTYLKKIFEEHENSHAKNAGSESDGNDYSVEICYNPESEDANNINEYNITDENKTEILNQNVGDKEKNVIRHSTKRQLSTCNICGEKFSSKSRLIEHQKKNINCKTKPHNCTECEKAFSTKFKLNVHMRSHTKEMPFECKICLKKFRFATNVKRHDDIVHKGLKPFKCDVCGKEFARLERKIEHVNIHTGKHPYTCLYCGDRFRHKSTYQNHTMQHKIKNGELQSIRDNQCHICKKIFVSKYSLHSHEQIHNGEKKFLCSTCGKCFLKKHNLDVHFRTHTEEKPFECKECNKQFKYASGYKAHILTHTGERPYKCNICSKTFKQSAHLLSHVKIHSGEKPFECVFCGKNFAVNSNLKVHTRIHRGEMPYHCIICNKAFYDSSSVKKHEKRHDNVKKSIKCTEN